MPLPPEGEEEDTRPARSSQTSPHITRHIVPPTPSHARTALRQCDNSSTSCQRCLKSFSTRSNMLRHVRSVHDKVKLICDVCNEEFLRSDTLADHKSTQHDKAKCFKCDLCSKSFGAERYLAKHKFRHLPKRYTCSNCLHKFVTSSELKRHILFRHTIRPRNFNCSYCLRKFKSLAELLVHKRRHFQHNCPACSQRLYTKGANLIHCIRWHPKYFVCKNCFQIFKTLRQLAGHKKIHNKQK